MPKPDIELTEDEQRLISQLELHAGQLRDPGRVAHNGHLALTLTRTLLDRDAIPAARLKYFTDPDCNVGGHGRSKKDILAGNHRGRGHFAEDPHYLQYLRFFICGPDLPEMLCNDFHTRVEECGQVTSGDVEPLALHARTLARYYGLVGRDVRDEFFKLALDCGLEVDYARVVRDAVGRSK